MKSDNPQIRKNPNSPKYTIFVVLNEKERKEKLY